MDVISGEKIWTDLSRLCKRRGIIPTPYNLEGVVREGNHSQRICQGVEIWKGRYRDEAVALKVMKVSRQDPHVLAFRGVSMPHNPLWRGFAIVLTCSRNFARPS